MIDESDFYLFLIPYIIDFILFIISWYVTYQLKYDIKLQFWMYVSGIYMILYPYWMTKFDGWWMGVAYSITFICAFISSIRIFGYDIHIPSDSYHKSWSKASMAVIAIEIIAALYPILDYLYFYWEGGYFVSIEMIILEIYLVAEFYEHLKITIAPLIESNHDNTSDSSLSKTNNRTVNKTYYYPTLPTSSPSTNRVSHNINRDMNKKNTSKNSFLYRGQNGDYDKNGKYSPGQWRREYDKEAWRYHRDACDHFDHWDCNDDEHF